jgi:hypothetical protein
MEEPSPGREEPAMGGGAHTIVSEVQLVPHRLEHMVAHHLLDGFRGIAFVHLAGRSKEREVELAPDDKPTTFALDASTGKQLWSFVSGGSVNASPAIVDGRLFWGSGFANYGLGDPNPKLFSFSRGH